MKLAAGQSVQWSTSVAAAKTVAGTGRSGIRLCTIRSRHSRICRIDTSEVVDPRRPVECFGGEASAKAHELLDGQTVAVEADPTQGERGRYGRRLGYIWLGDGRLFNLELLTQGYAFEYTYDMPYKYQAAFKQAERDAREAQRGLWSPQSAVTL